MWICLLLAWADVNPDIDRTFEVEALIDRADQQPLRQNGGDPIARVQRDEAGQVTRLRLEGLELSPREFAALARISSLRSLSLQQTNVADADLVHLRRLPRLTSLNLNQTRVTDRAIEHLAEMPALRSLCLMRVGMTRAAVDSLRAAVSERSRSIGIGFVPLR